MFSTVYDLLSQVVFRIKPSVHAAYRDYEEAIGASIVLVYDKLNGLEPHTSAELVRSSATAVAPLIEQMGGSCMPWVPGCRVKILDGNYLEATEHRLKELREVRGALPDKSLVLCEPALGLVTNVFPCEDGHAQERTLLRSVVETFQAGDVWIQDRNFCTCGLRIGKTNGISALAPCQLPPLAVTPRPHLLPSAQHSAAAPPERPGVWCRAALRRLDTPLQMG